MNRFENKVVVITGAAGGIGEATTRRIVSEGGKVVIADHSEKKAEQLANELTHAGADVRHVYFSATELQSCKELIDFSMNEYQRIDVLINNVGGTDPKRDLNIEKLDINYFDEAFHLNLCCTMYLSQQVIPIMTTNGGGNIVNVASISGLTADANGTLYGASKAGVTLCSQSLTICSLTEPSGFRIRNTFSSFVTPSVGCSAKAGRAQVTASAALTRTAVVFCNNFFIRFSSPFLC